MAPKKKTQKMALNAFFADTTGSDWADEMDNLPTAPAPKDPNAGPQRGEPGYLDAMPDRGARAAFNGEPREQLPIPTQPPYTAHVGNMAFETDEEAVKAFFSAQAPLTARIMKDPQGQNKGYGYVEFPSGEALKGALALGGSNLGGRNIRVSVAEPPTSKGRDFAPSAADEASQWRRSGPLPAREAPPAARRQGSYNDAPASGGERDWSSARGARFTPSVPPTPSGLRRDSSGPGREREYREPREPSQADEAGQWRSSRPMAEPKEQGGRGGERFDSGQSSPSMADTESTWSRGTKLRTPVATAQDVSSSGAASPAEEKGDWRSSRATSAVPSNDGGDSPRQAPVPLERRKLTLAPRSAAPASPSTPSASNTESIFGSAKPIDTAAKEQAAMEKMKAREEERKKAREEAAKKEEEANRKVLEDRAQSIRDAQAKAMAEVTGQKPPARTAQPPRSNSQGQSQGGKRRGDKKVGEDGFELAKGSKAAPAAEKPAAVRKESTTRSGFSFAAAAGRGGFAAAEEEEGEGEKEGVEDVTTGVEEVTV